MIGLVGILIPALSVLYQWRSLKAEKKSLEKDIQDALENAKLSIRNDLIKEMKEQISIEEEALSSRMQEKISVLNKQIENAKASIFFLQAQSNIEAKRYGEGVDDYITATKGFVSGEEEVNVQASLDNLANHCLNNINKTEYEDNEIEEKINSLIKFMESDKVNVNGRYTHKISTIKIENKNAKVREPASN